jgi:hypothetical protein
VVKYMVIFTDGKWNSMRTMVAAPGYTNVVNGPPTVSATVAYVTNATANQSGWTNGHTGAWSTTLTMNTNLMLMPSFSPGPDVTNAIAMTNQDFSLLQTNHYHDVWQSVDSSGYEPLGSPTTTAIAGAPTNYVDNSFMGSSGGTNYYTHNLDVWLQPGSVDYLYHNGVISNSGKAVYVSNYNTPNQHINVYLNTGDSNVLVVPGYVVDGCVYDGLDLPYASFETPGYPKYRADNYGQPFMWSDDKVSLSSSANIYAYWNGAVQSTSLERELMFRNYPNLLTGYYVNLPDEPLSTQTEPLDDTAPPTQRPLYGLGEYYPSSGFYWPFSDVGVDYDVTYALTNATADPDLSSPYLGVSRHATYSTNMLQVTPEWYGELFYNSVSGGGVNVVSGTGSSSASQIMQSDDWQNGAPSWMTPFISGSAATLLMTNEPTHNTNIVGSPSVWRPLSFNGSTSASVSALSSVTPGGTTTGGWVTDGSGNYYPNAMAWSGRPTHYYDFSQAKWVPVANNHVKNTQMLPICYWKAQEYAWHARALGVTVYTVGYGQLVSPAQQVLLAQIANSTNTTAGNPQTWNGSSVTSYTAGPGTAITYNPSQPVGQQYYATNITDISNDFYQVGQAINAALTQ